MAKISSYPSDANVTTSDRLIGSDNENSNETKNFQIGDIINLAASIILPQVGASYVPYTGATGDVFLGVNDINASGGIFSLVSSPNIIAAEITPMSGSIYLGSGFNSSSSGIFVPNSFTTILGDVIGNANGTIITIDDNTERISFSGLFNLSNGVGAAGQVLTSQGSGAYPIWTTLSSSYVPYTGATANVNLGTHSLTASSVSCSAVTPNGGSIYLGNIFNDTSGIYVPNGQITTIGDAFFNGNGTIITVDDNNQRITFVGGFSVSGNEGTVGQALISNGPGSAPSWGIPTPTYSTPYLSAYSSLQQNALGANTATPMYFHTTDLSSNVAIVSNSIITPVYAGIYNIQFSAQIQRTTGGASATIDIWLRSGGVDVPNTNTSVNVQANAGYLVASWNFFVALDPEGLNYDAQIMWATTDTNVILQQQAANAVHPATPSTILTVNKIHD